MKFLIFSVLANLSNAYANNAELPCQNGKEVYEHVNLYLKKLANNNQLKLLIEGSKEIENKNKKVFEQMINEKKSAGLSTVYLDYVQAALSNRLNAQEIQEAGGEKCLAWFQQWARTVTTQIGKTMQILEKTRFSNDDTNNLSVIRRTLSEKVKEQMPNECKGTYSGNSVNDIKSDLDNFLEDQVFSGKTQIAPINRLSSCISNASSSGKPASTAPTLR